MLLEKYPADVEIDEICDEFELELTQGVPDIVGYLERVEEGRKSSLLYWLLRVSDTKAPELTTQFANTLSSQLPRFRAVIADVLRADTEGTLLPDIPGFTLIYRAQRGGQGDVYKAIQRSTGQQVAIKLVASHALDAIPSNERNRALVRLEEEIRTTASLDHPNIVKVYDAGNCDDGFYFVMQWIEGGSLAERGQDLTQVEVARTIRQVADAVRQAHRFGILHLDIKPHNILYDPATAQPLLADFGLARLAQEVSGASVIAGTRGFMAPEQAAGGELDTRTDIYGIGATLYNMLTKHSVYEDVSLPYDESEKDRWIAKPPRALNSDVNLDLNQICLTCVAFDPRDRFQDCEQLIERLDEFFLTDDARRIVEMGQRTLATSPLFLIINCAVTIQLHLGWSKSFVGEVGIWLTVFSMYGVVFYVFGSISKLDKFSPEKLAYESLCAVWMGKLLAASAIAASLRLLTSQSLQLGLPNNLDAVEVAVLMCYPMFAALTGLVLASIAPRYWRFLYLPAAICWLSSTLLMWSVNQGTRLGPIIYGFLAMGLAVVWGLRLNGLAREQSRLVGSPEIEETLDNR